MKKGIGIKLADIDGLAGESDLRIDLQRSRIALDHLYVRFLSPMDVSTALEQGEKVLKLINRRLQKNFAVCRFAFKFFCAHDFFQKCKGHLQCQRPELCRGQSFFNTPIRAMRVFYINNAQDS